MPTAEAAAVYHRPLPEMRKESPFLDGLPAGGDVRIGTVKLVYCLRKVGKNCTFRSE